VRIASVPVTIEFQLILNATLVTWCIDNRLDERLSSKVVSRSDVHVLNTMATQRRNPPRHFEIELFNLIKGRQSNLFFRLA
jgi:hypothetical protein